MVLNANQKLDEIVHFFWFHFVLLKKKQQNFVCASLSENKEFYWKRYLVKKRTKKINSFFINLLADSWVMMIHRFETIDQMIQKLRAKSINRNHLRRLSRWRLFGDRI